MSLNSAQLADLQAAAGVIDFANMNDEQFARVVKKAVQGRITLEQLRLLVQVVPQFLQLQEQMISQLIAGVQEVAKGARESQKDALQAVGRSLESVHQALHMLAQNAQTDHGRVEIAKLALEAGKQGIELARIIEQMNQANNSLWWKLGTVLAAAIVTIAGAAAGTLAVFIQVQTTTSDRKVPRRSRGA
ncbi:MAG TPA: hypothetical protein DDY78_06990 [Planctomycetales bacterium]|jgi:hypothetical protein|nr:hypothetical protein [Planctomycetales bacterium]